MDVHATHTVHAVPDLRIAAGRFAGRFLRKSSITSETFSVIAKGLLVLQKKPRGATVISETESYRPV